MTITEKITRAKADYDEVYEAGYEKGKAEGGATSEELKEAYEQGKRAVYDERWDSIQSNGDRYIYDMFYAGRSWNDDTFEPKHDMQPTSASYMFARSGITDLKGILERLGRTLDFSRNTTFTYIFQNSAITNIGIIDTRKSTTMEYTFNNASSLVSVDKVILKDDGSQKFGSLSFANCDDLVEIRIEGVIGQKGFSVSACKKLSKASITSIVNALSSTTSGLSITISKTAVNNAFETAEGLADGSTSEEWLNLIATKPNWTISLS